MWGHVRVPPTNWINCAERHWQRNHRNAIRTWYVIIIVFFSSSLFHRHWRSRCIVIISHGILAACSDISHIHIHIHVEFISQVNSIQPSLSYCTPVCHSWHGDYVFSPIIILVIIIGVVFVIIIVIIIIIQWCDQETCSKTKTSWFKNLTLKMHLETVSRLCKAP